MSEQTDISCRPEIRQILDSIPSELQNLYFQQVKYDILNQLMLKKNFSDKISEKLKPLVYVEFLKTGQIINLQDNLQNNNSQNNQNCNICFNYHHLNSENTVNKGLPGMDSQTGQNIRKQFSIRKGSKIPSQFSNFNNVIISKNKQSSPPKLKNRFSYQSLFPAESAPPSECKADQFNEYLIYIKQGLIDIWLKPGNECNNQRKETYLFTLKEGEFINQDRFLFGNIEHENYFNLKNNLIFKCQDKVVIEKIKKLDLIQVLREEDPTNYQSFCQMKDDISQYKDNSNLYTNCQICKSQKHSFIRCPLLNIQKDTFKGRVINSIVRQNHKNDLKFFTRRDLKLNSLACQWEIREDIGFIRNDFSDFFNKQNWVQKGIRKTREGSFFSGVDFDQGNNPSYFTEGITKSLDDIKDLSSYFHKNTNANQPQSFAVYNDEIITPSQRKQSITQIYGRKASISIDEKLNISNQSLYSAAAPKSPLLYDKFDSSLQSGISEEMIHNLNNNLLLNIPQINSPVIYPTGFEEQGKHKYLETTLNSEYLDEEDDIKTKFSKQSLDINNIQNFKSGSSVRGKLKQKTNSNFQIQMYGPLYSSRCKTNFNQTQQNQQLVMQQQQQQQAMQEFYDEIKDFEIQMEFENYFPHNNISNVLKKQQQRKILQVDQNVSNISNTHNIKLLNEGLYKSNQDFRHFSFNQVNNSQIALNQKHKDSGQKINNII